jgi:hypothetical protein
MLPVLVSGVFGFFAGSTASQMGIHSDTASFLAGLVGFLGAQAFNYACLVLSARYRKSLIRRRK